MKQIGIIFLIFVLCVLRSYGAERKIQVLILSGRNIHDWEKTTPKLQRIYEHSGLFKVTFTETPEDLNAETLKRFDVVVSNWSSYPDKGYRWPDEAEKALIEFIQNGGGLVTLHAATSSFYDWPEFAEISTGVWQEGTEHGKECEALITIQDAKHPVTKGMADFSTFDELWMKAGVNTSFEVLATAVNENTQKAKLNPQPVISVKEYGKGRILHNALGHEYRNMQNTGFQTLLLRGTEWVATGKVKQKLPQEMKIKAESKSKYKWSETDTTFALLQGKDVVWQYNFREFHQKPHFNPVFVGRNNITCVSPDDHVWHAGQWFSWKYINHVNYWEYGSYKGYRSDGTTEVRDIRFVKNPDFSAEIELDILYHPINSTENVMAEKRRIKVSAPQRDNTVSMDYKFEFTALADKVELNRTPLEGEENGMSWGGYGGLSMRFNQSFFNSYFIPNGSEEGLHGQKRSWFFMGFNGLDGKKIGSQIIIHPNSSREEAAWYITDRPEMPFYFFNPAYLFEKPYILLEGEKLELDYRINHFSGEVKKDELEKEYQKYLEEINL